MSMTLRLEKSSCLEIFRKIQEIMRNLKKAADSDALGCHTPIPTEKKIQLSFMYETKHEKYFHLLSLKFSDSVEFAKLRKHG